MYDHMQIVAENNITNHLDDTVGGYVLEGFGERYRLRMWGQALFPGQQPGKIYDGLAVTGETYNDLLTSVMLLARGIPPHFLRYVMASIANAIFYAEGAEDIRRENKEN